MPIETIFILSQLGDLIGLRTYIGKSHKDDIPEFYLQFTRRFKGNKLDIEYPIIKIQNTIYAFVTTSDILVGAITTQDMPVLYIYSTLFHIVDVLKGSYADGVSAEKIKANFASVELMLDSFLDYGLPLIPQKFVLESIAKPSGVMEKIEEAIVGRHNIQKDQKQVLDLFIDSVSDVHDYAQHRISEIKGDEEILFDVIEYLDCVIDKNGKYIIEEINGEIKMDCNLSGTPELFIFLNQPIQFNDFSVHEILLNRIDTYEKEKVLNFIPPTGSITIFYYNIKGIQVKVPFDFIPRLQIADNNAKIELKLLNRPVRGQSYKIDDLHIKLIVPSGLTLAESDIVSGQLVQLENALLWKIGKLDIDNQTRLSAQFNGKDAAQLKSKNFIACIKFTINQYSASGTKIEKVEVRNGSKSLTKKARNLSKSGYYEIRLN